MSPWSSRATALLVLFTACTADGLPSVHPSPHHSEEASAEFWNDLAQRALRHNLKLKTNDNVAKNLILFLGDGMGIPTVTAARILKGQRMGHSGEEQSLEFEKFPHVSLVKPYNVDRQVPDSAGTSTAYLCGVKGNYETLGLDAGAVHSDCDASIGREVTSILAWAQEAGKDTGFVTTTRVTHASPAGLYAHSPYRYWETDSKLPANASRCKDIARQLIEDLPGRDIKVILGGGRIYFTPESHEDPSTGEAGLRKDERNLIEEWKNSDASTRRDYLENGTDFERWDPEKSDQVLGLFGPNHMDYDGDRDARSPRQPSLAEMTEKAIRRLGRNPRGFFLFVEGGRIDHAHHDVLPRYSLEETLAMDRAIRVATEWTREEDTLIVVTADHSHVMTINGYPARGASILGFAEISDVDHMPYATLMYTNGPGYVGNGTHRANLTGIQIDAKNFTSQVGVLLTEETHGGEDVAVYARGPMAHLFRGVQEQNYIPHAMAYAACIGKNSDHCGGIPTPSTLESLAAATHRNNGAPSANAGSVAFFFAGLLALILNRIWAKS